MFEPFPQDGATLIPTHLITTEGIAAMDALRMGHGGVMLGYQFAQRFEGPQTIFTLVGLFLDPWLRGCRNFHLVGPRLPACNRGPAAGHGMVAAEKQV